MKISIVIPTYGRPDNLLRAIKSALNQDYENIEVIVVDDNDPSSSSRYETEKIIKEISDIRLIYIKHKKNSNGSVARNTGVNISTGNYIAFLDDDDEFCFDKISKQIHLMLDKQYDISYSLSKFYLDDIYIYSSKYNKNGNISYDVLCSLVEINSTSLIVSKQLHKKIGGFNESLKRNQDYDFLIRCLEYKNILCVDEFLIKRHIDSKINQLNVIDYIKVRQQFVMLFHRHVKELSFFDKINFYSLYNLDIAYYALKHKNILHFIFHLIKIVPTWFVFKSILKKIARHK